jgi:ABC-type glycerol-3-phosphate transport system substrate-binding protein
MGLSLDQSFPIQPLTKRLMFYPQAVIRLMTRNCPSCQRVTSYFQRVCVLALGLALLSGCPAFGPQRAEQERPFAGLKLRVMVIDDPPLASEVRRLQEEWKTRTGAELDVLEQTAAELAADKLNTDAVIYPSHALAVLARRELIMPVPLELLDDPRLAWDAIFDLVRLREALWGPTVYAIPFGSPVLTCYYRADLLTKFDKQPPRDWDEYQELAEFFGNRANLGDAAPPADRPWFGTCEPLGPGWAGLTLLARAAPYAKLPGRYSTLFEIETMEPLVAGPPFVRALEELVTAHRDGPAEQTSYTPDDVRQAFWRGECGLALTWPSAAIPPAAARTGVQVGFAALPGAGEAFDPTSGRWQARAEGDSWHVPLLSSAGRLGSVSASAQRPDAAFQLLIAMADREWSQRISTASTATTMFRDTQLTEAKLWVEPTLDAPAARQYGTILQRALTGQEWLFALRLPGREQYLAALDEAVALAIQGDVSPAEALTAAANRWREVTAQLGVDAQRSAYRQSLGLSP